MASLVFGEGNLYVDPTDLSAAAPYGGTELGSVQDIEVRFDRVNVERRGMEFGNDVIGVRHRHTSTWVNTTVQAFDADFVLKWFANTTDNSDTVATVEMPEGQRNTTPRILLFVPTQADEPAFLAYAAFPDTVREPVRSSSVVPMELRVRWRCGLDDNGNKFVYDKFSRLSLT